MNKSDCPAMEIPEHGAAVRRLDWNSMEDRAAFEAFVEHNPGGSFYQSLRWAEVKKEWSAEALFAVDQGGAVCGTALVLCRRIPVLNRTLLYVPRGPVCAKTDGQTFFALTEALFQLAREMRGCLLRIDPPVEEADSETIRRLEALGFVRQGGAGEEETVQGKAHYRLNLLGQDENSLLQSFHPKWRYNIRLAQKRGVRCRPVGEAGLDDFYELLLETGARDGFAVRSKAYFRTMLRAYGEACRLYLCEWEGIPLAGAVAVQYAGMTSYVYGASTALHREKMPNYLLQWELMRWALSGGSAVYDFQGIPHYGDPNHPNYGVYRFKCGFRGQIYTYAGDFDLLFSPAAGRLTQWAVRAQLQSMRRVRPAAVPAPLDGESRGAYDEKKSLCLPHGL